MNWRLSRSKPGSPEMAAQTLAALKAFGMNETGGKAWAYRLKAKEAAGESLCYVQRRLWREALRERV
jgi:uncharacterized membrane protein